MKKTILLLVCIIAGAMLHAQDLTWLTNSDFLKKVYNYERDTTGWKYLGNQPAIILFVPSADWCSPCEQIKPVFKELATEYKDEVLFYMVDIDREKELSQLFGINNVPSMLFISLTEYPSIDHGYDSNKRAMYQNLIVQYILRIGVNINGITWAVNNVDKPKTFVKEHNTGKLYTWKEAKTACPKGWRLPTKEEWEKLCADDNSVTIWGFFHTDTSLHLPTEARYGYYWSSSSTSDYVYYNYINTYDSEISIKTIPLSEANNHKFCVRCVKE